MSIANLPFGINVIISGIAAVLYVAVLISIPFRIKKYGKRRKNTDEGTESDSEGNGKIFWLREIAIFVMSAVIIGLCAFISFGTIGNIVLCSCGVLGAVIASGELSGKKESLTSEPSSLD